MNTVLLVCNEILFQLLPVLHYDAFLWQLAEKQDGSADDFQEINNDERRTLKGRYSMDAALEDKICDLYDLYVEVPNITNFIKSFHFEMKFGCRFMSK